MTAADVIGTAVRRTLPESIPVAVVGAGQAGLAAGYHLGRAGIDCVLLDAGQEIGQSWAERWDSLRLFTSARFCSLPGMPFPGPGTRYPAKDEVVAYLRRYAEEFSLPVLHGHRVRSVEPRDGGFLLRTDHGDCHADQVVIATGAFGAPWVPPSARDLDPAIPQWHASGYRNAAQVPLGLAVVVGAGNSGVQIAKELSNSHDVVLSAGTISPEMPQTILGRDLFWWMSVLGVMTMPVPATAPDPVVGNHLDDLVASDRIRLTGPVASVEGQELVLQDGERLQPNAVIWATGFRHAWNWLAPEMLDPETGTPRHDAGVGAVPGSYYLGLYRMRNRGSALLGFLGRDAEYIVGELAQRATLVH